MTRSSINLLSRSRRRRLACRRTLHRWTFASLAYASLIAIAWAMSTLLASSKPDRLAEQLARGDADIKRSGQAMDALRGELASVRRTLDMRRAALDRADWSDLLRTIGAASSPDVTLREMRLESSPGSGGTGPRLSLVLSGTAPSQLAASQFTVRLQKLGLFDTVDLNRSGRDASNANAVAFEVTCAAPDEEVRR